MKSVNKTKGYLDVRTAETRRFSLYFFKVIDHACALFRDRLKGPHESPVVWGGSSSYDMVEKRCTEEPRAPIRPPGTLQNTSPVAEKPAGSGLSGIRIVFWND